MLILSRLPRLLPVVDKLLGGWDCVVVYVGKVFKVFIFILGNVKLGCVFLFTFCNAKRFWGIVSMGIVVCGARDCEGDGDDEFVVMGTVSMASKFSILDFLFW